MAVSVYQQGGYGTAPLFPSPVIAQRDPTTTDRVSPSGQPYQIFQGWNNELTDDSYIYLGAGNWVTIASIVGSLNQLSGDSGTALPVAGNINILGGTNITTVGGSPTGDDLTINLDAAISLATSVTSPLYLAPAATDMDITATLGQDIDVTLGDAAGANNISFFSSTPGLVASLNSSGDFTAIGDISSSAASLSAATTVTAGTGITATTGNIEATAGQVNAGTSITAGTTLTATLGDITATNGNLVLGTAGNKIEITTGANASAGTATLASGTVTVNTSAVTANSLIFLSRKSIGSTGANPLGLLVVGTITAGASFVINAVTEADATSVVATDVSDVDWWIIN